MKLFEIAEPQTLEDFLTGHCKPFLNKLDADAETVASHETSTKLSLYRGVKVGEAEEIQLIVDGEPTTCYIKTVREDRRPLDTHPQISAFIDEILKEKFGWKPRSQGLFCFGWAKRGFARDYGKLCKIYPMGEVTAVYSPEILDLTPKIYRVLSENGFRNMKDKEYSGDEVEVVKSLLSKLIEVSEYSDDLKSGMDSGRSEIMVKCSRYLAVPFRD